MFLHSPTGLISLACAAGDANLTRVVVVVFVGVVEFIAELEFPDFAVDGSKRSGSMGLLRGINTLPGRAVLTDLCVPGELTPPR